MSITARAEILKSECKAAFDAIEILAEEEPCYPGSVMVPPSPEALQAFNAASAEYEGRMAAAREVAAEACRALMAEVGLPNTDYSQMSFPQLSRFVARHLRS